MPGINGNEGSDYSNGQQEQPQQLKQVELFGGAIVASLPANWRDISDFVPVPDNQEIY